MNVTVLYGGPSAEREVSLISGKAVIEGLRSMGHDVFPSDVSPTDLSGLDHPCDVVFPVLHGEFGESGELQEILEQRRLPFVGSGSKASRLGMDKVATKKAWEVGGLPTPPYFTQDRTSLSPHGMDQLDVPCVVKAFGSGSSIDVYVCKTLPDAQAALDKVLERHGKVLVEKFIKGPELTVGLIEEQPLAPIRIVPKTDWFDYEAKYKSKETEHRFDTGLSDELIARCKSLAKQANDVIAARDLARIDIMIDEATQQPYLLEINTMPGFTPVSLLPEAARHAGIDFGPLVDRLIRRAAARGAR
jgi:D-alanine-D-alanine ligase